MKARADNWMPFYFGDYLRDTMHLRTEGHGAYFLLIAAYWIGGEPLPDDDEHLASIARMDVKKWRKLKPTLAKFFEVDDGAWRHGRIDRELERANSVAKARREAGSTGGKAKANALANSLANALANPLAKPQQKATPLQLQLQKKESKQDAREEGFSIWWEAYPHKVGRAAAVTAYAAAIDQGANHDDLVDGAKRYAVTKPAERQWCNPTRWLCEQRWRDDPAEAQVEDEAPAAPPRPSCRFEWGGEVAAFRARARFKFGASAWKVWLEDITPKAPGTTYGRLPPDDLMTRVRAAADDIGVTITTADIMDIPPFLRR